MITITAQTGCSSENQEPYALRVIGNSMSPEFMDGNIIIVDPAYPVSSGVYAVIETGTGMDNREVIFGQLFLNEGQWSLCFMNQEFAPIELDSGFTVKGVVTQKNARRRKDIKHYDYPATLES